MSKNLATAIAFLAAAFLTRPAHAVTLDFVALAAGNEHSFATETFPDVGGSGISVTATARALSDNTGPFDDTPPWGYLDDLLSGDPAGLGVCQTANCAGSSDDNISLNEVAILEFDAIVEVTSISFSNGLHLDVYVGSIGIQVGAGDPTTAAGFANVIDTASLVAGVLNTSLIGNRFSFVAPESFGGVGTGDDAKIYISSITFDGFTTIPEPSTALLLSLGAVGLAVRARRSR